MENTFTTFDDAYRDGGFYELTIQVCPVTNSAPIRAFAEYIWELQNCEGPYDEKGNLIPCSIEKNYQEGLLHFGKKTILFSMHIEKEENGFYWFSICFHAEAIKKVFGSKYKTNIQFPKPPPAITTFFNHTMKALLSIYPYELAMIGQELSGQYYLQDFTNDMSDEIVSNALFYVPSKNISGICEENKPFFTVIEQI